MAGRASGGQSLTPNPNVVAPAGMGGALWGANGGGITPIGAGATGPTGWDERVGATLADGQTAQNYQVQNPRAQPASAMAQESTGALSTLAADDALPVSGSNSG